MQRHENAAVVRREEHPEYRRARARSASSCSHSTGAGMRLSSAATRVVCASIISFSDSTYRRGALAVGASFIDRAGERPELVLQHHRPIRGRLELRGVGNRIGEVDPIVRIPAEQPERLGAHRLSQRLGPQVRRPDRVRLVNERRAARLVSTDRHRQTKRQQQGNEPHERSLHHTERLLEPFLAGRQRTPDNDAGDGRTEDDPRNDQCQRKRRQPSQHHPSA